MRRFYRQSGYFEHWRTTYAAAAQYWKIYGGWHALCKSPYFQISLLLSLFCLPFWPSNVNAYEIALSVVPNLLGFTVGALAIVLAFSTASIFTVLAEDGEPRSFFMQLTVSLIHFIGVQVFALVLGVVTKITQGVVLDKLELFFLFYAILSTLAAGFQLFHTAIIYNTYAGIPREDQCAVKISEDAHSSVKKNKVLRSAAFERLMEVLSRLATAKVLDIR